MQHRSKIAFQVANWIGAYLLTVAGIGKLIDPVSTATSLSRAADVIPVRVTPAVITVVALAEIVLAVAIGTRWRIASLARWVALGMVLAMLSIRGRVAEHTGSCECYGPSISRAISVDAERVATGALIAMLVMAILLAGASRSDPGKQPLAG